MLLNMSGKVKYITEAKKPWCVAVILPKDDLFNYYAWWIRNYCKMKVQPPMLGPHITVVREDKPLIMPAWKYNEGCKINFTVSLTLRDNGFHYWLPVIEFSELSEIRIKLGLQPFSRAPFHLTIARYAQGRLFSR